MSVSVQTAPFDVQAETAAFCAGRTDVGAIASFLGVCRDATAGKGVSTLFLDYFPGFTERALEDIEAEARAHVGVIETRIVHRAGLIHPGEPIVIVLAAAAHRAPALEVVAFIMDHLKTDAPFWKREDGPHGARWIEPLPSDHQARASWEKK